jgi:hypothetical protein
LQTTLAASLGLVFQLDALNYSGHQFRNSDLSVPELRKIIADQKATSGQPGVSQSFESLLQMMEGSSFLDTLLQAVLRLLGASRKFQALSKLALMETIDQIKGDPSEVRGLPPDLDQLIRVLIEERDRKVIADLKSAAKRLSPKDSAAIIYGTGHMPDLERRLRKELKYHATGEQWLTAFSVNLAQSGVSRAEREFIRGLVTRQLDVMQKSR